MAQIRNPANKKWIKLARRVHRISGLTLFTPLLIIGLTGILLGWKKNSAGWIQAKTIQGTSVDLKDWLSLDSLYALACQYLHSEISQDLSLESDRFDVRSSRGTVRFNFPERYWSVHVDGATGKLVQIERRRSDFIENIHDFSILDRIFSTKHGQIKLLMTTVAGVALLLFVSTGLYIWYWPRRNRN